MMHPLPLKHQLAHTGVTFVDDHGYFYKNSISQFGTKTAELDIFNLLGDLPFFPSIDTISFNDTTMIRMKQMPVIGFDDIKNDSGDAFEWAKNTIEQHFGDLIQAINTISQLGIVYNDLLQVGYDADTDKLVLLDFSNASMNEHPEAALNRNIDDLSFFLSYYDLGFYSKLVSRTHTLLNIVKNWDADMLKLKHSDRGVALSWKIIEVMNLSENVEEIIRFCNDGNDLKNAYFSFNSRHIQMNCRLPQTLLNINGKDIRIAFSEQPLPSESLSAWELLPLSSFNNLSTMRENSTAFLYNETER